LRRMSFFSLVSDDNDERVIARLCEAMHAFHNTSNSVKVMVYDFESERMQRLIDQLSADEEFEELLQSMKQMAGRQG